MHPLRLLALLALSSGLAAAAGQAETLVNRSPFLPLGGSGTSGVAPSEGALELRGVMSGSVGYLFYVYDPVKRHGVWAGSNETESPFTIVAADPNEGSLEIRMSDGRHIHLKLRDAKTLTEGVNSGPASKTNAVAGVSPNPSRLTEVQAAWREEFNRRLAENSASQ
jgi:hypothetical protein